MPIYEMTADRLRPIAETSFGSAGVRERADLQRLLRTQIDVVSADLLVIAEEFCEWEDSRCRIDLLALDRDANLVVIELKRTEDGGHMELQALRYAAMVSAMTFEKVVEVYTTYLNRINRADNARNSILDFLGWEEADEDHFAQDVRIVLVSAEFSKELTTTVLWLNGRGLDIRCVRIKPYADNGHIFVDVQQVIPLVEAADIIIKIKEKEARERSARREQSQLGELCVRFWTGLLERAKEKADLHFGVSPSNQQHLGRSAGNGTSFVYAFGRTAPRVELYITGNKRLGSKQIFDRLLVSKSELNHGLVTRSVGRDSITSRLAESAST